MAQDDYELPELPPTYLTCEDQIPQPDASSLYGMLATGCFDDDDACEDELLEEGEACIIKENNCMQLALLCVQTNEEGFPVYRFRYFNRCRSPLSQITFRLPAGNDLQTTPAHDEIETFCGSNFKVTRSGRGNDQFLTFRGKVAGRQAIVFEYTVHRPKVQSEIEVIPEAGPFDDPMIFEMSDCFDGEGSIIENIQYINKWEKGNTCDGKEVIYRYRVYFNNGWGPQDVEQTFIVAGDEQAPTGQAPSGQSNLSNLSQVPAPNPGWVASYYSDNCGSVYGEHYDTKQYGSACEGYTVEHHYYLKDQCGKKTQATVTHKVKGSGSSGIYGKCPDLDQSDLHCLSEVPEPDEHELVWYYKEKYGAEVTVKFIKETVSGNDCYGFTVKHKYKIQDKCGNYWYCYVTYSGKDDVPPYKKSGYYLGKSGLTDPAHAPDPYDYMHKVKEAFTDKCNPWIQVKFIEEKLEGDHCGGDFKVKQKYKIIDECGNFIYYTVVHKGHSDYYGGISGVCPDGADYLQCLADVPTKHELIQEIKDNYHSYSGGDIYVELEWKDVWGNECSGFQVKYKFKIWDDCGTQKTCTIKFTGKDTEPPKVKSNATLGKSGLHAPEEAPDPNEYMWVVKSALEDNCNPWIQVQPLTSETVTDGCSGEFQVIQKYKAIDECGNSQVIKVIHYGKTYGSGQLVGSCPDGLNNLQCLKDVPGQYDLAELLKSSFQGADGKEVTVKLEWKDVWGNECSGFRVKYKFKITDNCGNSKICYIEYTGKDTLPPHLKEGAQLGEDYLTSPNQVPSQSEYMWKVKEAVVDNCTDWIEIKLLGSQMTGDDCSGNFKVEQKYQLVDECGNSKIIVVIFKGSGYGGGGLTGSCPADQDGLQCLADVPGAEEVKQLLKNEFKGADGGSVNVSLLDKDQYGDECDGFRVVYKFRIKDNCGNKVDCTIKYQGKDTKAPTGVCPDGLSDLATMDDVPDPDEFKEVVRQNYTDNCSDWLFVALISEETEGDYCSGFTVTQKYAVGDECGNTTTCIVKHTGGGDGMNMIVGTCPPNRSGLDCITEVPTAEDVRQEVLDSLQLADGGEVTVKLIETDSEGDDCNFSVRYKYRVTGGCDAEKICTVKFTGADDEPPAYTSTPSDKTIDCGAEIEFDKPEAEDACGLAFVVQVGEDIFMDGDCPASFTIVRTWVARDTCGNAAEEVSQSITIPETCCQNLICAFSPVYWGQNFRSGSPNVIDVIADTDTTLEIASITLDSNCIEVLLPGEPVANAGNLDTYCPEDIPSNSLVRHTIALKLNLRITPELGAFRLKDLACPVGNTELIGLDENDTVLDLLAAAEEAVSLQMNDNELADALASVNECYDCRVCEPLAIGDDPAAQEYDEASEVSFQATETDTETAAEGISLKAFPNPSSGRISLEWQGLSGQSFTILVHDAQGQLVYSLRQDQAEELPLQLDLSREGLSDGMYFISAVTAERTLSTRLVIDSKQQSRTGK